MIDKQKMYEFMKNHTMMVISSTNYIGETESAAVGFGQTEDLTIIFGTSISSRKAKNIMSNRKVSIVIGWDKDGTIQCEGKATLVIGDERSKYSEILFNSNPASRKYKDNPEECYIIVKPSWIRYTDVSTKPWTVEESEL